MLQELLVHGFAHHHLLIELDQEFLGLLTAHFVDLGFKRAQTKLLLQSQLSRFVHRSTIQLEKQPLQKLLRQIHTQVIFVLLTLTELEHLA